MYIAIFFIPVVLFLLLRFNIFVLDGNVFNFQVAFIEKRGRIDNLRDYRAVHTFVEQEFDRDPDAFESSARIRALNQMLADFHANQ